MNNLGINQLILLERAFKKPDGIGPKDVKIVYYMPEPSSLQTLRMQREQQILILKKLAMRGLLKYDNGRFHITKKGVETLKENLQKLKRYKWKKWEGLV